jgi:hypothetical protein
MMRTYTHTVAIAALLSLSPVAVFAQSAGGGSAGGGAASAGGAGAASSSGAATSPGVNTSGGAASTNGGLANSPSDAAGAFSNGGALRDSSQTNAAGKTPAGRTPPGRLGRLPNGQAQSPPASQGRAAGAHATAGRKQPASNEIAPSDARRRTARTPDLGLGPEELKKGVPDICIGCGGR